MHSAHILPFLVLSLILPGKIFCMFEWLFAKESTTKISDAKEPIARFEVLSSDDKFLDLASTLEDLSPLDKCYHIVIYLLKKRCGELSEEELGKLSVQLLNCQCEVENRPIFTCTKDMTLSECTKDMDGVTWNSYQIVGNRARAMCYATQQLQFRRLTENSVNQLAAATAAQLQSMIDLKNGQEQLQSMTVETIRGLFESQQELLVTHEALRSGQQDVVTLVTDNLLQLQQEKALIATGNKQLAELAEKIRAELNITSELIKKQGLAQQAKHEDILRDLKNIQSQAAEALARLESSSEHLLSHHTTLQQQQQEVFGNLQKINATVFHITTSVSNLQIYLEQRIAWITQLLGGADYKLEVLQCCALHVAYLLLTMVVAAFLHTPVISRVILMAVVVANMAAQLAHNSSLEFAGLTAFMMFVLLGHWILQCVAAVVRHQKKGSVGHLNALTLSLNSSEELPPLSRQEMRNLLVMLQRLSQTLQQNMDGEVLTNGNTLRDTLSTRTTPSTSHDHHDIRETPSAFHTLGPTGNTAQDLIRVRQTLLSQVAQGTALSYRSSRASTPSQDSVSNFSRSSTPSVSSRCLGRTQIGGQCRLPASQGSDYCRRHTQNP